MNMLTNGLVRKDQVSAPFIIPLPSLPPLPPPPRPLPLFSKVFVREEKSK